MLVSMTSMKVATITETAISRCRRGSTTPALLHSHFWFDGPSGAQSLAVLLAWLEANSHRQLNDLHVIPGGIFRRQQAESCSRRAGHDFDEAIEILAQRIHMDGYGLQRVFQAERNDRSCVIALRYTPRGPVCDCKSTMERIPTPALNQVSAFPLAC